MKTITKTTTATTEKGTVLNLTVTVNRGYEDVTKKVWIDEYVEQTRKEEINETNMVISAAGRNIRGSFSTFIGQDLRAKGCYGMFHGDGVVIGLSEKVYNELYSVVRQAIAEAETDENWQQLMAMRAKAEAAEEEYKKHVESVDKMMTLNGRTY